MFTDGRSVVTLYSVPARTLVSPLAVNSLPLRLRTMGGPEGAGVPLMRPPPGAILKTTGVAAAGGLGAPAPGPAPGPGPPARGGPAPGPPAPGGPAAPGAPPPPKPPNPTAPPPPPTVMRPISPLHTTAFQVGLASQASSASIPVLLMM